MFKLPQKVTAIEAYNNARFYLLICIDAQRVKQNLFWTITFVFHDCSCSNVNIGDKYMTSHNKNQSYHALAEKCFRKSLRRSKANIKGESCIGSCHVVYEINQILPNTQKIKSPHEWSKNSYLAMRSVFALNLIWHCKKNFPRQFATRNSRVVLMRHNLIGLYIFLLDMLRNCIYKLTVKNTKCFYYMPLPISFTLNCSEPYDVFNKNNVQPLLLWLFLFAHYRLTVFHVYNACLNLDKIHCIVTLKHINSDKLLLPYSETAVASHLPMSYWGKKNTWT